MGSLRYEIESDLADTLEGEFGMKIILEAPDGTIIDKSANDSTADLMGQVLYDTTVENPETGGVMLIGKPVVSIRRSSLSQIPSDTDYSKWFVKIPRSPINATMDRYKIEKPPVQGKSIGFIVLELSKAIQV
jgi:hypothetical protein